MDRGLAETLCLHIRNRESANNLARPDREGMPSAQEAPADPLMENVLASLLPAVERISGTRLHPTYSFVRVYRRGDRLIRHRDRISCEVSVSVNLGGDSEEAWPLWVAGACGERAARLGPGDGLLYRGHDCEHWREPFEGSDWTQLFLHYVDQEGPYAHMAFDGRERLSTGRNED